jgi:hypothetical protein
VKTKRKTKATMGRPPIDPASKLSQRVPVMVSNAEMEAIKASAQAAGKTVSAFCRAAILGMVQRERHKVAD